MSKQIKFHDIENDAMHGGILLDDGNVICGCCGGIFKADEEGVTWKLVRVYDTWVDLTDEICGEDDLCADVPAFPERISEDMVRRGLTDGDINGFRDVPATPPVNIKPDDMVTPNKYYLVCEQMHNGKFHIFMSCNPRGAEVLKEVMADSFGAASREFSFSTFVNGKRCVIGFLTNGEPYTYERRVLPSTKKGECK